MCSILVVEDCLVYYITLLSSAVCLDGNISEVKFMQDVMYVGNGNKAL